jgi:hypothetical protein
MVRGAVVGSCGGDGRPCAALTHLPCEGHVVACFLQFGDGEILVLALGLLHHEDVGAELRQVPSHYNSWARVFGSGGLNVW